MFPENSDCDLLSRIQANDIAAFELLNQRHGQAVMRTLHNVFYKNPASINAQDRDDTYQEIWIKVWEKIQELVILCESGKLNNFPGYLYRMARNKALSLVGSTWKSRVDILDPIADNGEESALQPKIGAAEYDVLANLEREQQQQWYTQAFVQLPSQQREALDLFHQGYSHDEIALILEAPLGTIQKRIQIARRKIKTLLLEQIQGLNQD